MTGFERARCSLLVRDYCPLFAHLSERTWLFGLFTPALAGGARETHHAWSDRFLVQPSLLGIAHVHRDRVVASAS